MDVDVSLRHIDVTMSIADCTGLCKLSSVYSTHLEESTPAAADHVPDTKGTLVKPLFREDFWYFDSPQVSGDADSRELNFDSLSSLLEQVSRSTNDDHRRRGFV